MKKYKAPLNKNILATYNEIKIDRITYRLISKFEGNKNLDKTIRRLAIKKATRNS